MTFIYYFQLNPNNGYEELHLSCDGNIMLFKEFQQTLWNKTMMRRMDSGESLDPDDVVVEYYEILKNFKKYIPPAGDLRVKIIKEINKVIANQLEFVIKMCEKQTKNFKKENKVSGGGVYVVTASNNGDTIEQVCMVCGDRQGKLKRCSACGVTCYCSAECQKKDWKEHKLVCGTKANIPNGTRI